MLSDQPAREAIQQCSGSDMPGALTGRALSLSAGGALLAFWHRPCAFSGSLLSGALRGFCRRVGLWRSVLRSFGADELLCILQLGKAFEDAAAEALCLH